MGRGQGYVGDIVSIASMETFHSPENHNLWQESQHISSVYHAGDVRGTSILLGTGWPVGDPATSASALKEESTTD